MQMLSAFTRMIGDLYAGDCPDRQIDAVCDWEDDVRRVELALGGLPEVPADAAEVVFAGASSLRTWRVSCYCILRALEAQSGDADLRQIEADAEADERVRLAEQAEAGAGAAEDEASAAACRAEADRYREEAAAFRDLSGRLGDWRVAADDAHAAGTAMLNDELPRAQRVSEAQAAAGGAREVYGDKHWADNSRPTARGRAA